MIPPTSLGTGSRIWAEIAGRNAHMEILLDFDTLMADAERRSSDYRSASPFPHIVIDDFLPQAAYRGALTEYPSPEQISDWRRVEAHDDKGRIAQNLKLGYSNEQR